MSGTNCRLGDQVRLSGWQAISFEKSLRSFLALFLPVAAMPISLLTSGGKVL
jgi:hypothetical protein